ncbi:hypothetical protein GW17_00015539 [Ensete ventricosum]|nr:hypothetical protein GW17_00015539 [Ensete ventricosum]
MLSASCLSHTQLRCLEYDFDLGFDDLTRASTRRNHTCLGFDSTRPRASNAKSNPLEVPLSDNEPLATSIPRAIPDRTPTESDSSLSVPIDLHRIIFVSESLAYKRSVDLFGLWLLDGPRQAWNAGPATGTAAAGGTGGLGDGHAGCAVRLSGRRMGFGRAHPVAHLDEQQQDRQPLCGYFSRSQQ